MDLPLFLELIRQNVILYTILTTGSFQNLDLQKVDHYMWSNKAIEFKDFSLSDDEKFSKVMVTFTDQSIVISMRTDNHRFMENTKYYFSEDTIVRTKDPYYIDNKEAVTKIRNSVTLRCLGITYLFQ